MAYSMKIDPASLASLKMTLTTIKNGANLVISRATNDAVSGLRTEAVKLIGSKVTAKAADIRATFAVNKMTLSDLTAHIECKSKPLPLIKYSVNPVKKGVSVKVLKVNPRSIIRHAFIATMKSGHKGVFWRKWDDFRKPYRERFPYGVIPKTYRLPIKELYGPRIPDILDDPGIMEPVLANAETRLHDRLNHHAQRLLDSAR